MADPPPKPTEIATDPLVELRARLAEAGAIYSGARVSEHGDRPKPAGAVNAILAVETFLRDVGVPEDDLRPLTALLGAFRDHALGKPNDLLAVAKKGGRQNFPPTPRGALPSPPPLRCSCAEGAKGRSDRPGRNRSREYRRAPSTPGTRKSAPGVKKTPSRPGSIAAPWRRRPRNIPTSRVWPLSSLYDPCRR